MAAKDTFHNLMAQYDNERLTPKEFEAAFAKVVGYVKEHRDTTSSMLEQIVAVLEKRAQDMETGNTTRFSELQASFEGVLNEKVANTTGEVERALQRLQERMDAIVDGPEGPMGPQGEQGLPGKDGSPDTGEQIITKINDADGQIDKERIKGLKDIVTSLEGGISKATRGPGGGNTEVYLNDNRINSSTRVNVVPLNDLTPEVTTNPGGATRLRIAKITVSDTQPSDPNLNDLWVDIS